jgi:hypothetical protein
MMFTDEQMAVLVAALCTQNGQYASSPLNLTLASNVLTWLRNNKPVDQSWNPPLDQS